MCVGEVPQGLGVGLLALAGTSLERARLAEIAAADTAVLVTRFKTAIGGLGLGDFVPGRAVLGLARRVGIDVVAQFGFLLALEVEYFRILQRKQAPAQRLV